MFYLFTFRERWREGERAGDKHECVRDTSISCLSHAPTSGHGPQPRHVPWPGSNWRPFGSEAGAQSSEPHQLGMVFPFLYNSSKSKNNILWHMKIIWNSNVSIHKWSFIDVATPTLYCLWLSLYNGRVEWLLQRSGDPQRLKCLPPESLLTPVLCHQTSSSSSSNECVDTNVQIFLSFWLLEIPHKWTLCTQRGFSFV